MTEVQAEAVVRLQLGQLAGLERDEIFKEYNDLRQKILGYETLLSDDRNVRAVIREELVELSTKYGNDRRTEITGEVARLDLAGVDGAAEHLASRPGDEGAAAGRNELVGGQPPIGTSVDHGRRITAIGHGGQCRIGRSGAHREAVVAGGASVRSGSRSGVVIASWAIRRKSPNDITGISSWPSLATVGVPSSIRIATIRSGWPG